MPALSPGPSAHATSWHQFHTAHSPSSVLFVSIRRTAFESQVCCRYLKPLAPLLFSCTYELQISQPLSFHNHTNAGGVYPTHTLFCLLFSPRVRHVPLV